MEATATLAVLTARPDLMHLSVAITSIIATKLTETSAGVHADAGLLLERGARAPDSCVLGTRLPKCQA